MHVTHYVWQAGSAWIAVTTYSIVSIVIANAPLHWLWQIPPLLALVVLCVATQREGWRLWQRVLFVLGAMAVHQFLLWAMFYTILSPVAVAGAGEYVVFLTSIPVVLAAMRQSRLFVHPERDSSTRAGLKPPSLPD